MHRALETLSFAKRVARLVTVFIGASALLGPAPGRAQTYPAKPIRLIIPFAAGGPRDLQARLIAPKLNEALGQPIVIDNRAGASGVIGTELAAKAQPDGYTLLMLSLGHAINATLYPKLPYDSVRDFAFITTLSTGPGMLVVHPSLPVRSVRELIEYARSKPGQLSYASAGSGAPSHLSVELFKLITHTDIVHIPYKSMAPGITDLISGQVQMSIPTIPAALPFAKAGKLRALAVTGARRTNAAPELPTMIEAGIPGYTAVNWYGIAAPAATPRAVIDRLNADFRKVIASADVQERMRAIGIEPESSSAPDFASFVQAEVAKWGKVVRSAGLKAD